MAILIVRDHDTDDDGTLTVGTIHNAAWKEAIYDRIDAVTAQLSSGSGQFIFPATQNPSANPNTLDDYEEGTFTPGFNFGGASVGMTFSTRTGTYTKIGNMVVADVRVTLTAKGSSTGIATITGLPFSVTSIGSSGAIDFAVAGASLTNPYGLPNGTSILLCQTSSSARVQLTDANFTNTSDFRVIVTFFA